MAIVKRILKSASGIDVVVDWCDECNTQPGMNSSYPNPSCFHVKESILYLPPPPPKIQTLTGSFENNPFKMLNHLRILNGLKKLRLDAETLQALGIDPEKTFEDNIYFVKVD